MSNVSTWWPLLILVVGGGLVAFLSVRVGPRTAILTGLAVAALFIDQRAAARGARSQKEKDKADAEKRARERERINADVAGAGDDDLDRRFNRWVPDDGDRP